MGRFQSHAAGPVYSLQHPAWPMLCSPTDQFTKHNKVIKQQYGMYIYSTDDPLRKCICIRLLKSSRHAPRPLYSKRKVLQSGCSYRDNLQTANLCCCFQPLYSFIIFYCQFTDISLQRRYRHRLRSYSVDSNYTTCLPVNLK